MDSVHEYKTRLPLDKAVEHMLEECRMVLPGIQALFGFQLIAVFNNRFDSALDLAQKRMHMAAICLIVIAIALIMAPAALHRLTEPQSVSERYLMISSRLILAAMVPLAGAILLETWLVASVLLGQPTVALVIVMLLGAVLLALWWAVPVWMRSRR